MIIGIDGNEANIVKRVGSNQYAFELLHALKDLKSGDTFIIYLREQPLADLPKADSDWQYKVFGPKKFWTQWRLPIELYFGNPRPQVFFTPGHYAPRWSPIQTVISIMDLGYLKFPKQFTKKDLYQLTAWTKRSIKSASHIFAISESTKNDIIKAYGIAEDKITVTYPGYDASEFKVQSEKLKVEVTKEKYGIKEDYILFLSTLKPSKNIIGLLQAFKLLDPGLKLAITGKKGWMFEEIFQKTEELGLKEKVLFTDYVAAKDVPGLMAGAKVFVLPSFWEGFGIPVVEAMASGVPVVVSDRGSLPEIVGDAGIIVNPDSPEAIAQGIKKAIEKAPELIKAGLEKVKQYSWKNCAEITLKEIKKYDRN
jgi:glycosyltransferase involved in cell wall biosynthesis